MEDTLSLSSKVPSPGRAPVAPRGRMPSGGEVLPLEDLVRPFVEEGAVGAIQIVGGHGAGKSVAIEHLKAAFAGNQRVWFVDEPGPILFDPAGRDLLLFVAGESSTDGDWLTTIELAPWGDDEAIEYLLACHRERCASVMARVRRDGERAGLLRGNADLWRVVLDEMVADNGVEDVFSALCRHIDREIPPGSLRRSLTRMSLLGIRLSETQIENHIAKWSRALSISVPRLASHRAVRMRLAAEAIVESFLERSGDVSLRIPVPPVEIVRLAARFASDCPTLADELREVLSRDAPAGPPIADEPCETILRDPRMLHPLAASILLAIQPDWRPAGVKIPNLDGALLARARWSGIALRGVELRHTDLHAADLTEADLSDARLIRPILSHAVLRRARLDRLVANTVDMSFADLSGAQMQEAELRTVLLASANLEGANLRRALLSTCSLERARCAGAHLLEAGFNRVLMDGADFTNADFTRARLLDIDLRETCLEGAIFAGAFLHRCDLERIELTAPDFHAATLHGSYLTGSVMPRANFRSASLRGAGLAEIDWEGADLRDADFEDASFHMGSSRSGLVGSLIAGEGSKTGFYTDDYAEQDFKPPEEIRKANLCGADLRGAKVLKTDFYLVDLRGAKYTPVQAEHFARCGAILRDRARGRD